MDEILIGTLVNTHGLRGEVKVKTLTDFSDVRFAKGKEIHIQYQSQLIPVTIQYSKWMKNLLLVKFKNINDINDVEKYKGCALSISKDSVHELEEDEAYFFELKNCHVFDEDGNALGIVEEVLETTANAVLRVSNEEHSMLVPYVKAFIVSFDRENKKIVMRMMDGLL